MTKCLVAIVTAALLTACTSAGPRAPTISGDASLQPASAPVGTASAPAAASALNCGNFIDTKPPPANFQIVLGVVALPTSPAYPALQTGLTGNGNGPLRLFAKTGLVIKGGTTFELIVPAEVADHLSIGWGGGLSTPSHRFVVSNCAPADSGGWLSYPGGYWIDHPACVPLVVKTGDHQQQVHIGIGTSCPGQQPPQGPTNS